MAEEHLKLVVEPAFDGTPVKLKLRVGGEAQFYSLSSAGVLETRPIDDDDAVAMLERVGAASNQGTSTAQRPYDFLDGHYVSITHVDADGVVVKHREHVPEPAYHPVLCGIALAMVDAALASQPSLEGTEVLRRLRASFEAGPQR